MDMTQVVLASRGRRSKWDHPYNYDPFTTWKATTEPDGSVYSDRLYLWDHEKHDRLCDKHFGNSGQYWGERKPKQIEAFLRDYLDAPGLVLCEIQEHCNQASGFPVWYLAYRKNAALKEGV